MNVTARTVDVAGLPPCVRKYLSAASRPAERDALLDALAATNWNKTKAAGRLQWSRMTLYRKMAAYHIVRTDRTPAVRAAARTAVS